MIFWTLDDIKSIIAQRFAIVDKHYDTDGYFAEFWRMTTMTSRYWRLSWKFLENSILVERLKNTLLHSQVRLVQISAYDSSKQQDISNQCKNYLEEEKAPWVELVFLDFFLWMSLLFGSFHSLPSPWMHPHAGLMQNVLQETSLIWFWTLDEVANLCQNQ